MQEGIIKKLLLGGGPEHLEGVPPDDGPRQEDRFIGRYVIGSQQDSARGRDVIRTFCHESIEGGCVEANDIAGKGNP